jgi:hypothetical protein
MCFVTNLGVVAGTSGCTKPPPAPPPQEDVTSTDVATTDPDSYRAAVRLQLAAHRADQILHLHAYGEAGQFPHNETVAPSLHMFKDAAGRLCAVANLVQTDGRADLVDTTVREHNDLAIADVHGGPMMDWILTSGLTQEELVRIQLPAPMYTAKPRPRVAPPSPATWNMAENEPMSEVRMNAAVARHVVEVERELLASSAKSLDVAVQRFIAGPSPDAANQPVLAPVTVSVAPASTTAAPTASHSVGIVPRKRAPRAIDPTVSPGQTSPRMAGATWRAFQ